MMAMGQMPGWMVAIFMFLIVAYMIYQFPKQDVETRPIMRVIIGFFLTFGLVSLLTLWEETDFLFGILGVWLLAGFGGTLFVMMVFRYLSFSPYRRAKVRDELRPYFLVAGGVLVLLLLIKLFV